MDSFEEDLAYFLPFDEAESDETRLKKCIDQLFQKPLIVNDTRSANNTVLYNVMGEYDNKRILYLLYSDFQIFRSSLSFVHYIYFGIKCIMCI